jgi:hypothetical protein
VPKTVIWRTNFQSIPENKKDLYEAMVAECSAKSALLGQKGAPGPKHPEMFVQENASFSELFAKSAFLS